jgi:hypothetical protein
MSFATLSPTFSVSQTMVKSFYQDEYATIELDDSIPCIRLTLTGVPRHSDHYALVQTKRLELLQQESANFPKLHMLTDSRNAGPVLNEDVGYFREHVLSGMEKAGVRFLAIVMPASKYTQLTIREMTEGSEVLQIKLFTSMREARYWLRKKNSL